LDGGAVYPAASAIAEGAGAARRYLGLISGQALSTFLPHMLYNDGTVEVLFLSYQQYGISTDLVERIKKKMQNPMIKEKVVNELKPLTKADLQNPAKVKKTVNKLSGIMGLQLSDSQADNITKLVLDQKIDPKNTFHLIRLWGMFR
jgi:hypothetical protein